MFNFVQFEFNLIEMLLFNLALDLTENPAVTQFPKRGVKTGVLMIPMPDLFHLHMQLGRIKIFLATLHLSIKRISESGSDFFQLYQVYNQYTITAFLWLQSLALD